MNKPLTGREAGLVGYWNFDEGTGATAHDRGALRLDAPLIGGTQWITSGVCPNTPPELCWVKGSGFQTDGVDPNSGPANTWFRFRVTYRDADCDPPASLLLWVSKGGVPVSGSPFQIAPPASSTVNYAHGGAFGKRLRLSAGSYSYRFSAADRWDSATGTPTGWQSGPTAGAGAVLLVGGAAALGTRAAAEVTFTLSSAAQVEVRVVNLAGRPVANICLNRACEAGRNVLTWDGRGSGGALVPSGRYIIALKARAEDGAQASALVVLDLQR
jgi:hypothetical protein